MSKDASDHLSAREGRPPPPKEAGAFFIAGVGLVALAVWFVVAPRGPAGLDGLGFIWFGTLGAILLWLGYAGLRDRKEERDARRH